MPLSYLYPAIQLHCCRSVVMMTFIWIKRASENCWI